MRGARLIPVEAHEYSLADAFRALAGVVRRSARRDALDVAGLRRCIPVRSGRVGILLALRALQVPDGGSVGVPLYCCPVVLKAVRQAGCVPLFVDIDPATYCMAADDLARKASRISAAIAVDMFGNTCDMSALRAAAGGKPIIEDCAQALGSRTGGSTVGAAADVAVFSFRSGKYISAGEGAAVFVSDADRESALRRLHAALPVPSMRDECRHVLEVYLRSKLRTEPLWGVVGRRIWQEYNKRVEFEKMSPIIATQPFLADLVTVHQRMPSLAGQVVAQRGNAQYYAAHLRVPQQACVSEPSGAYYNRYSFPIRCDSGSTRDALREHLLRMRVTVSTPYAELLHQAPRHYDYAGDCPASERALEGTLVIPTHYRLTEPKREHVVRAVNDAIEVTPRLHRWLSLEA